MNKILLNTAYMYPDICPCTTELHVMEDNFMLFGADNVLNFGNEWDYLHGVEQKKEN